MIKTKGKCVYRSSDYKDFERTHVSSDDPVPEDSIEDFIIKKYIASINHQTDFIQQTFLEVYGEHLNVKDNMIRDTYLAIKNIEKKTKLSLAKMATEIKDYVEKDIKFLRTAKKGLKPIRVERIAEAYNMMRRHKSSMEIEHHLFGNNDTRSIDKS